MLSKIDRSLEIRTVVIESVAVTDAARQIAKAKVSGGVIVGADG